MSNQFRGTGVALVTPFQNGAVDYDGLQRVIEHTIDGGVDYLVSLGTTGETPTLSIEEKFKILDFTVKINDGRLPIVAGFGGNNTKKLSNLIKQYHFNGIDGILSASPAYNKPTQEGIYQHFMALAEVAPRPIILYNVPSRTSSNMTTETTLKLAESSDTFVAVKEASGDMFQISEIIAYKPENFLVLSGDDALAVPVIACGGDGVISVIANAVTEPFTNMVNHALKGNFEAASMLHHNLLETIKLLFIDGNPAGVKTVLELLNICSREVRLPLANVSQNTYERLQQQFELMI